MLTKDRNYPVELASRTSWDSGPVETDESSPPAHSPRSIPRRSLSFRVRRPHGPLFQHAPKCAAKPMQRIVVRSHGCLPCSY